MSGGDKPKAAKVAPTRSVFDSARDFNISTDFGSATATQEPFKWTNPLTGAVSDQTRYSTTSNLSAPLKGIADQAQTGLSNNMGFLQMDPNQRIDWLTAGKDPTYNLLSEMLKRDTDKAMGRSIVDSQGTGTMNSTTAGAAQGTILNDQILRSNQNLLNALNFGNENARADAGLGLNVISGLNGIVNPLASAANANQFQAMGAVDQAAAATAASQNAANQQYAAAMNQYNQQKSAGLGGMIGGGVGLLGSLALAPFTGGASLLAAPGMMAMMGGGGKSSGSGYIPQQSYGFGSNTPMAAGGYNYAAGLPGLNSSIMSPDFASLAVS